MGALLWYVPSVEGLDDDWDGFGGSFGTINSGTSSSSLAQRFRKRPQVTAPNAVAEPIRQHKTFMPVVIPITFTSPTAPAARRPTRVKPTTLSTLELPAGNALRGRMGGFGVIQSSLTSAR